MASRRVDCRQMPQWRNTFDQSRQIKMPARMSGHFLSSSPLRRKSAAVTAMMADRPAALQVKSRHRSDDIEAGFPFKAYRLQRECIVGSADKTICRTADTY